MKRVDALMIRFLQGTCSEEEKAQFLSWLNENSENEVLFFQMKEIFDARKRFPVYEKMYGVDIHIETEDLEESTFSGMFTTDYSLKEVLEIINISNPISYTIQNKVVFINSKSIKSSKSP